MGKLIVDRKKPKTESSDRYVFIPESKNPVNRRVNANADRRQSEGKRLDFSSG